MHKVTADRIVIVVPVKDNQAGINRLLESFFNNTKKEFYSTIVIVDNNSEIPIYIPEKYLGGDVPINLLKCSKIGAGSARNLGVEFASKHYASEWVLFVDSDCIFTSKTIVGYLKALDRTNAVNIAAYQGSVESLGNDWLSKFYDEMKTLAPSESLDEEGNVQPNYLVTANVLVSLKAFTEIGGFSEKYVFASEDVDLAYRLAKNGKLTFAKEAYIQHDYLNGETEVRGKHIREYLLRLRKYGWGEGMLLEDYNAPFYEELAHYSKKSNDIIPKIPSTKMRRLEIASFLFGINDYANQRSPFSVSQATHLNKNDSV